MRKILAFNGSPRKNGNTALLLRNFHEGTTTNKSIYEEINPYDIDCN
jgi:multimeric flavodoxin WrbA